jgi:DNA-binding beta-propeller fold protein YncE
MKGNDIMKKLLLLFSLFFVTNAFAITPEHHVINKLQLGGEGGWDDLSVDEAARRLYVSHSTHVMVVDLNTDKVIGDIPNTPGVHAIAIAPELNRGFISSGQTNTAIIFDLKTLKILGQVKTGTGPDAILYDPASKQVFAFNGRSSDATVFDAATGVIAGTIALNGKPEFSKTDGKGKVYVNIEDTSEVVEIDSLKLAITRRFPINPGEEPSGMGIDVVHHRIFSGCRNKLMTVLDIETGKVIATVPIGERCDGVGFDQETGLAFSSNGEGTLTVVKESSPGKFEVAETAVTQSGARTMTIDPKTHNVYLPVGPFSPGRGPAPGGSNPQTTTTQESFIVMVVGK